MWCKWVFHFGLKQVFAMPSGFLSHNKSSISYNSNERGESIELQSRTSPSPVTSFPQAQKLLFILHLFLKPLRVQPIFLEWD